MGMNVSCLPDPFVRKCHLHPAPDPEAAIEKEIAALGPQARIAYIPHAGFTLPVPVEQQMPIGNNA